MSAGEATAQAIPRPRRLPPPLACIGLAIVAIGLIMALLGPFLARHGAGELISERPFPAASWALPFGGDHLGRDVLSRLLHAAPVTIGLALGATTVGFVIGLTVGFFTAEVRGRTDTMITWILDILVSFPPKLIALIAIAGLGSSLPILIATFGFVHAPRVARVARAVAMNISAMDFVEAARARGELVLAVMVREIWPSARRPMAVEFGLRVTFSILVLSSLSFLGLGVQPPMTDWGSMVRENMSGIFLGTPAALIPALAIGILTVGINLVIDWIGGSSGRRLTEELSR